MVKVSVDEECGGVIRIYDEWSKTAVEFTPLSAAKVIAEIQKAAGLDIPFAKLIVGPDETLVFSTPQILSEQARVTLKREAAEAFGLSHSRIVVLEHGLRVGSVKAEPGKEG